MGHSFVKVYLHIVFSTKNREPFIFPAVENELYAYIGGICNSLECFPIKIGGYFDHVHIVCSLSKKIAIMKLLEVVKANSSKWFKTKDKLLENFYWQTGYGAWSVNPAEIEYLIRYIENQHAHHKRESFKEEFLKFLKKYGIDYDERYLWD